MFYTGYELLWLFFLYSFLGWCMEVIHMAMGKGKFVNRGFLNGVVCPVYGFAMVFMLVFLDSLKEEGFYLFLGCMIVGSVIELLTGLLLEKAFQIKLWDYSNRKFQFGGYICLTYALAWGVLGTLVVKVINPLCMAVLQQIPYLAGVILLAAAMLLLAADTITTVGALVDLKNQSKRMQDIAEGFTQAADSLRNAITVRVKRRMEKAFPGISQNDMESEEQREEARLKKTVFAYGCGLHKIVWIFFLGALLGDIAETIFCRITIGHFMSRSSVVYGPFSLVWGIGVAGFTILLYKYRNREDRYLFAAGTLLGGAYEYICSVFTELCFGTVFWDYSDIPFNLGGRINLLYCFFWGIAALVWMKLLYPFFSKWIERVPMRPGKIITYVILVFMAVNIVISAIALGRYSGRQQNMPPGNAAEVWMDRHFDDERMEHIYPNAEMTK